jgi:hypothetical protein
MTLFPYTTLFRSRGDQAKGGPAIVGVLLEVLLVGGLRFGVLAGLEQGGAEGLAGGVIPEGRFGVGEGVLPGDGGGELRDGAGIVLGC